MSRYWCRAAEWHFSRGTRRTGDRRVEVRLNLRHFTLLTLSFLFGMRTSMLTTIVQPAGDKTCMLQRDEGIANLGLDPNVRHDEFYLDIYL